MTPDERLELILSLPLTVHDAPDVTTADMLAYLDRHGWRQDREPWVRDGREIMRFFRYRRRKGNVGVPMCEDFADFKSRIYDFFRGVARIQHGDERRQLIVWLELHDIHAEGTG